MSVSQYDVISRSPPRSPTGQLVGPPSLIQKCTMVKKNLANLSTIRMLLSDGNRQHPHFRFIPAANRLSSRPLHSQQSCVPDATRIIHDAAIDTDDWRDRILDNDGNIDNVEQERLHTPDSDSSSPHDYEEGAEEDDRHGSAAKNQELSTRSEDGGAIAQSDPRWPNEQGIEVGQDGEATVKGPWMEPVHAVQDPMSKEELERRDRMGWSEASCDEGATMAGGSSSRSRTGMDVATMAEHVISADREELVQSNGQRLQQLEEKVFEGDEGRSPADYHRRADFFGKSAEVLAARKKLKEEEEEK